MRRVLAVCCGSLWRFHALAHLPQRRPHKTHGDADMTFGWTWMDLDGFGCIALFAACER